MRGTIAWASAVGFGLGACVLEAKAQDAGLPVQELSAEQIEQLRSEQLLAESIARLRAFAGAIKQSSTSLDTMSDNLKAPSLSSADRETLAQQGPSALESVATMPSVFDAPSVSQKLDEASENHRTVSQLLEATASEVASMRWEDAIAKIASIRLSRDRKIVTFANGEPALGSVSEDLDTLDESNPVEIDGVDTFILGVGADNRTIDYPATGALLKISNEGLATEKIEFSCTGTLIGPTTFLTAAHCVCAGEKSASACAVASQKEARAKLVQSRRIYFPHSGVYKILQDDDNIVVKPNFLIGTASTTGDLALLRLAEPVRDIMPMSLNKSLLNTGDSAEIIGYGRTNKLDASGNPITTEILDDKFVGIKLFAGINVNDCPTSGSSDQLCWDYQVDTENGLGSACKGDSGGPVVATVGGVDVLVAVISAGLANGTSAASCMPKSTVGSIDLAKSDNTSFVDGVLARWAPSPSIVTINPVLDPTLNTGRYVQLSPGDSSGHLFKSAPATVRYSGQLASDSRFVVVGLSGTFSNAPLNLSVTDTVTGRVLCSVANKIPAKTCAFKVGGGEQIAIDIVGRKTHIVQVVATGYTNF